MKIIAYTYDADFHCPDCAQFHASNDSLRRATGELPRFDEHGLAEDLIDSEGNPIRPVFETDELPTDLSPEDGGYSPLVCGDCREVIAEAF